MKLYLITKKSLYNHIVSSHVVCAENKEEAVKVIEKDNKIYLSGEEIRNILLTIWGQLFGFIVSILALLAKSLRKKLFYLIIMRGNNGLRKLYLF